MSAHPKIGHRPTPAPQITDREALRALLSEADVLGYDPDDQPWLLIRTTQQLLDYLSEIEGAAEDAEESDAGEPGDEDMCVEDEIIQANAYGPKPTLTPPYNEDDEPEDN